MLKSFLKRSLRAEEREEILEQHRKAQRGCAKFFKMLETKKKEETNGK